MSDDIKNIASKFDIAGKIIDIKDNPSGNINKTFVITYKMESGEEKEFIFQKINTTVFK